MVKGTPQEQWTRQKRALKELNELNIPADLPGMRGKNMILDFEKDVNYVVVGAGAFMMQIRKIP